jgi:hypothetical protein
VIEVWKRARIQRDARVVDEQGVDEQYGDKGRYKKK